MKYNLDKYKYLNLDKWEDYKGRGINVGTLESVNKDRILNYKVVNSSNGGAKHGSATALTLLELVPRCTLHSIPFKADDTRFVEYVVDNNIKVIFASLSGFDYNKKILKELERLEVIFVIAAGNDDKIYVSDIVKEDYFTVVTSVNLDKEGNLYSLEQNHEYIDYACWGNIMLPHYNDSSFYVNQVGTSFATPFLAAIIVKLLEHSLKVRGRFATRTEIFEILDRYSYTDELPRVEVGKGIPVLPQPSKIRFKEDISMFKDLKKDRYSAEHIEALAKLDIITGYKDGTFRPQEPVTREQVATMLNKLRLYLERR